MKASATHIDRAASRIRAQLITGRNAMANQLRGLLKLFGLRLGSARTPGKRAERLAALYRQRPDLEALFVPLVAAIEVMEEQLRASNRLLEERAAGDPVCARLMSVPGGGPITALTYAACIEDPHRFARSEDVGAYAGLVPRRNQSGERDTRGNISKAGNPMLRRALYEAANAMLCHVQRPCKSEANAGPGSSHHGQASARYQLDPDHHMTKSGAYYIAVLANLSLA